MFLHEVLGNGDEPTDMSTFLLLKKENEGGWPVGVWDPSTPGTYIIMFISITSKTDIVMRKTVEPLKPW